MLINLPRRLGSLWEVLAHEKQWQYCAFESWSSDTVHAYAESYALFRSCLGLKLGNCTLKITILKCLVTVVT